MAIESHTRRRPSRQTSFLTRHREGFASRGWSGTARLAGGYAGQLFFDLRHHVNTRGTLYHLQEQGSWQHARAYQPVGGRSFAQPLAALHIDPSRFTFVDLGCGKGKALMLAKRAGFGRVIGVELSDELADFAHRNAVAAKLEVEVEVADATTYAFPDEPLVVFTYHSFDEPVLRAALANLGASLREHPREAYVVYISPQLATVLDEMPFLAPHAVGARYAVYRAA
jgi:SAM-dependent methyltransferase